MSFSEILSLPTLVDLPVGDHISSAEQAAHSEGYHGIIGVDEVGRGPLAGPTTVCAVTLGVEDYDRDWLSDVDDSKKLSASVRENTSEVLRDHVEAYEIVDKSSSTVDEKGVGTSIRMSMEEAVEAVSGHMDSVELVLVDGDTTLDIDISQMPIKSGDSRSLHIAAASILAKTHRDEKMVQYHEKWPEYGFDSNKGYGSQEHLDALDESGPCPIHRRSYSRVEEV